MIKDENRKGAAKPRPLCTPLGLFLECLTVAGGRVLTCACMLRLFRVERCADGAPWARWMCDVVGRGWRVCERRAWFAGMVVVCYVCVEYVGAFVDTVPGLPGWLWCVLRLRGIRGRVCGHCAWFAGMIVVCVYVCVVCVAFRGL